VGGLLPLAEIKLAPCSNVLGVQVHVEKRLVHINSSKQPFVVMLTSTCDLDAFCISLVQQVVRHIRVTPAVVSTARSVHFGRSTLFATL
jgi:hypothetical protein